MFCADSFLPWFKGARTRTQPIAVSKIPSTKMRRRDNHKKKEEEDDDLWWGRGVGVSNQWHHRLQRMLQEWLTITIQKAPMSDEGRVFTIQFLRNLVSELISSQLAPK